jgi:hypothetical protein
MCGVSPTGVPKYRSKIFDSPVPSYVDGRNKTFYADYAYISIKTLVAWTTSTSSGSLVNQAITAEGGLLSLRSQDLSSLRYATSSGFLVFQTHAFNFAVSLRDSFLYGHFSL